ncbi:MAG: WD40/YVTN/BNR-like repeat-containing protein, partial [Gemmata sp.]
MNFPTLTARRAAFGLLAALIFLFPGVARSDDEDDKLKKEIADVERQILELKKRLDELRRGPQPAPAANTVPEAVIGKLNWRNIGPANMGGRVTAVAVVESDPTTYYVATASGGLLKTVNNGTTFSFAFEKEATVSIGDVAVAPSDPNVVYVGTGENNPRNSASYGDGVYKSTDGGATWTNVGLKKSFSIGKIVIHPKDPNTVYVAAMGRVWGPNEERGVFKTEDGGKSWQKVLYVDDKTGAIELRMDPFDPNTVFAGLWERKRDEFDGFFGQGPWPGPDQYGPVVSHGPGGGLFKTSDGGKSWKKLTGEKAAPGLPTVKTGRIGLDYSRKTKGLLYAIIDTESIGKGRPPLAVAPGISGEGDKGGAKVTIVVD